MASSGQAELTSVAIDEVPAVAATGTLTLGALLWATWASTFHRVLLGEGALIAINVSLLWQRRVGFAYALGVTIVSTLTLALMYAFNDAYDAASDRKNPKKDQRVVSIYLEHRATCYAFLFAAKAATLLGTWVVFGPLLAMVVAAALAVNLVYSTLLKGVPVIDIAWCGVWGAAYAAIASQQATLLLLVGLMTAICHLYQALGDRSADADNHITTTAVFSPRLTAGILFLLSAGIAAMLWSPLGMLAGLSAFIPFALFFLTSDSRSAWLLTKAYFGVAWILVLGQMHAAV